MDAEDDPSADLEGLDIIACRDRIAKLQADRERRRESTERLQEKLKALNYELAARKEEVDRQRRHLREETEQNKRADEQLRLSRERDDGAARGALALAGREVARDQEQDQVRRFLEQHLASVATRRVALNELGVRTFDERDLMVQRPPEEEKQEAMHVDTVLLTHLRSASSEQKFYLSFRVDRNTTCKKLREDACMYWGISEVEYILWTMANTKVHDDLIIQNIFKAGEEAHLILAPKTPKKTEPPERVYEAIRPRVGAKSLRARKKANNAGGQNAEVQPRSGDAQNDNFFEQMAKVPGVFEFMTQRDRKVVSHLERIRLSSMCVYAALAVTTIASFLCMAPPNTEYFCRLGVYSAMAEQVQQPFNSIRSHADVWEWLTQSVSGQLLVNTSELRRANYLPGWLRIRMQHVRSATRAYCPARTGLVDTTMCFEEVYTETSAGKEDFGTVKQYWAGKEGLDGRSNYTLPWKFFSEADAARAGVGTEEGMFQSFDGSGYAVDYNLQYGNLPSMLSAYLQDMAILRDARWISNKTRAVHVSFTAYNANYDYWVASGYLLEMPVSGVVVPSSDVDAFRPVFDETIAMGTDQLGLDTCRLILAAYVLFHCLKEVLYVRSQKGKWMHHLVGPMALADLGIVGVMLAIYIVRFLYSGAIGFTSVARSRQLAGGYHDEAAHAHAYHQNLVLEAFMLTLVMFRLLALMRINRHVFLIWQTLHVAVQRYACFLLVFLPVISGFALVGHAMRRAHLPQYRTFWSSATSTFMILLGDVEVMNTPEMSRPWTLAYTVAFYICIVLVFINTWVAVVIQEYQKTRVAAGFRPKDYAWAEEDYAKWCLPPFLLKRLYYKFRKKDAVPASSPERA